MHLNTGRSSCGCGGSQRCLSNCPLHCKNTFYREPSTEWVLETLKNDALTSCSFGNASKTASHRTKTLKLKRPQSKARLCYGDPARSQQLFWFRQSPVSTPIPARLGAAL